MAQNPTETDYLQATPGFYELKEGERILRI